MSFDVGIVGAGPTGSVLANLLGLLGVPTVIIERGIEVYPVPRATHIDEETIRNLTLTGLLPQLIDKMSPFGTAEVADENGRTIFKERVGLNDPLHGRLGSCFFDQPEFEGILRGGLDRFEHITLISGATVTDLEVAQNGVIISVELDQVGTKSQIECKYVVGCDGGRSLVRKILGSEMRSLSGPSNWLMVDALLKNPADAELLPPNFQYRMGVDGLSLYAHGHGLNRRWEFRMNDAQRAMTEAESLDRVAKFIDLKKLEILRMTRYTQNALVADKWHHGRLLLAGDAAHLMPPAAGQGMCSGIRDAINLAWKLNQVIARPGTEKLLETYRQEREPHLLQMLRNSIFIGDRVAANTPAERKWKLMQLWVMAKVPAIREFFRSRILRPVALMDGCLSKTNQGGQHFPNFVVADQSSDALWGYQWAAVGAADVFNPAMVARLSTMGIAAIGNSPDHEDFHQPIQTWLTKKKAHLAIVRPDQIVYALVKSDQILPQLDALAAAGIGPK